MSKNLDKILDLFVKDSYRKFNVREVSRLTKLSPSTASNYLKQLVKAHFLKNMEERNYILYFADTESRFFKDLKIYSNIKKIRSSGIVDFIEKKLNYPEVIVLFGSYAKGENKIGSDIDLFILSESKNIPNLTSFEKKLSTKIQIFLYGRKDVEKMDKELVNNIINGVVLSGFFEVLK